jgi:hypothetical protein
MVALLPWGVRRRLNQVPGLPDAAAVALTAGALWAAAVAATEWRARAARVEKQKRLEAV